MDKLWIRSVQYVISWISEIALIHTRKLGRVGEMERSSDDRVLVWLVSLTVRPRDTNLIF